MDRTRIALVSLPWSERCRATMALAVLGPYLQQEVADCQVTYEYAYLEVAEAIGAEVYDNIALQHSDSLGELLYMALLYPEKRADTVAFVVDLVERGNVMGTRRGDAPVLFASVSSDHADPTPERIAQATEAVLSALELHLNKLAQRLADARHHVVGLTTSFGQMFANIALARLLKAACPETYIVMGGSTVSSSVGPSTLREYPYLDAVVQGEGEQPLVAIVKAIARDDRDAIDAIRGVVTQTTAHRLARGATLWELHDMDALPLPDFDAYAAAVGGKFEWELAIEGSRGCWWDRVRKTGKPELTCQFCNFNVQWGPYREKSIEKTVSELRWLCDRYSKGKVFFLDNVLRHHGVAELAEQISATDMELRFFYEMRANVSPYEFLLLSEAGLTGCQTGVEALDSSYLKLIGKGTTAIQNLEAMRTCCELGITNGGNLIVGFPGSTNAQVTETIRVIEDAAIYYPPLHVTSFRMEVDQSVVKLKDRFPIANMRNWDAFRAGLPQEVWERLVTFYMSYDDVSEDPPDWSRLTPVMKAWVDAFDLATRGKHTLKKPLTYQLLGSALVIEDRIHRRSHTLRGTSAEIYLYCMQRRGHRQIADRFQDEDLDAAAIETILGNLVEERVVFREGNSYLSLAVAIAPHYAARRIRRMHAEDQASPPDRCAPGLNANSGLVEVVLSSRAESAQTAGPDLSQHSEGF